MKFKRFLLAIVPIFFGQAFGSCPLLLEQHSTASKKSFIATNFWDSMCLNQPQPTNELLLNDPLFHQIVQIYTEFSAHQAIKELCDYSIPPTTGSIPAILHFIWLGSDLPLEAQASIDSWRKHHPGWQINIWKDADMENFAWTTERTKKNFYESTSHAEKADILRCEILYQFGGIYSDTDVICTAPFHDLITADFQFFAGIEVNRLSPITKHPLYLGSAIMGSAKGSQAMKYCLDHHLGLSEAPGEHILNRTGPGLCSRAAAHSLQSNEKVLILPPTYFYPFPFEYRHFSFKKAMSYEAPETMAIHLWRGSWVPKEKLEEIKQKSIARGFIEENPPIED